MDNTRDYKKVYGIRIFETNGQGDDTQSFVAFDNKKDMFDYMERLKKNVAQGWRAAKRRANDKSVFHMRKDELNGLAYIFDFGNGEMTELQTMGGYMAE